MEALLEGLIKIVNSPIFQEELGLLCGIETEIQNLSSLLSTTKAVLEDAEQKQFTNKAIQLWLQKLNLIAYEVDDILDDYATEVSREPKCKTISCNCLPATSNIWFRHRIGARMKKIIGKFDAVANERTRLGLSDHIQVDSTATRETGAVVIEPERALGRDKEKEKIVEMLVNQVIDNNQKVSVLPIVGIGGLGKTTLARLVSEDERVKKHFEPKLWVWVSEKFDVKGIIGALIESAEDGTSARALPSALDPLQSKLQGLLKDKRYLLVLDDVWNDDQEEWEKLKSVLACGSSGSSIVMTTRMESVATIMGTLQTHCLSYLPKDQCWSVFSQRAFGPQEEEKYPELVAIGKKIVEKCGGVPLAAKALGGLLRLKREKTEWNSVECSELWNLPEDEKHILPALRLSYLNLPVELKGCFAYCAVFPKGYVFDKEEVIRLWMANGLISSKEMMEVEGVGDAVLNKLHYRSLFQTESKDEFGRVLTFKMHDLVYDLAQSVMKDKHNGTKSDSTIRHLELDFVDDQLIAAFPIRRGGTDQCSYLLSKYGSLRTFIARSARWSQSEFKELLPAISKLKHLRYLNLSRSDIEELPNSICDLWNLQILNLNRCFQLRSLPKGMRFLRNLRHLCLEGCERLTHMPSRIGRLTNLQTLSMVVLGGEEGFRLSELRDLNKLRGILRIRHLERIEDKKDAEEAYLIEKQSLHELYLEWESERICQRYNDEEVLEALKPCPNLQYLNIKGFKGSSFPSWISTVTHVAVHLSTAEYIDGAQESTAAIAAATARPRSLKQLELWDMPNLKGMLGRGVQDTATASTPPPGVFSQLQSLSFRNCPALTSPLPRLLSLEKLALVRCPPNMAWASISNLTSLKSLAIEGVKGLSCFPEEMLQNLSLLESLEISYTRDLQVLPSRSLASLTALKRLVVEGCLELKSLPEEGLRGLASLQSLCLEGCDNLVSLSMGIKALKSLTNLEIAGSDATSLPEEFKHFPALQQLDLLGFPNLTSLPDWFGHHLTSLQHLKLTHFPKLETLPSSIQMMTALQDLDIYWCGPLGPRCEREGAEWHKIRHIPRVTITL